MVCCRHTPNNHVPLTGHLIEQIIVDVDSVAALQPAMRKGNQRVLAWHSGTPNSRTLGATAGVTTNFGALLDDGEGSSLHVFRESLGEHGDFEVLRHKGFH